MYLRLPWIEANYLKKLENDSKSYCFFCDDNIKTKTVIEDWGDFEIIQNQYSYLMFRTHLLIAPKEHIYDITGDLKDRVDAVIEEYYEKTHWAFINIPKNRSLAHAHWHLIQFRGDWIIKLLYKIWNILPWTIKFKQ